MTWFGFKNPVRFTISRTLGFLVGIVKDIAGYEQKEPDTILILIHFDEQLNPKWTYLLPWHLIETRNPYPL